MKYIIAILFLIAPAFAQAQTTTLQTATATLTWNSNTEPDIDSYIIMMGETSGVYSQTKPVKHIQGVAKQTGVFTGLSEGKTYFFVVKAVDLSGNVSAPTQEVSGIVQIPPGVPSGLGVTIKINIIVELP